MKILALETGGTASTNGAVVVALELGGDEASVVAVGALDEPRALGAKLIGLVDETLEAAGWKLADLNGLCLGSGPGSWTSLRVGFATWKTLAQIAEIPLVAVPSFDALAVGAQRSWAFTTRGKVRKGRDEGPILVALSPCRPGEFYGKIFRVSSEYVAPAQAERIAPIAGIARYGLRPKIR
jgi:tRNA threonylcarbamoyl adenosine modification protein YeaZ